MKPCFEVTNSETEGKHPAPGLAANGVPTRLQIAWSVSAGLAENIHYNYNDREVIDHPLRTYLLPAGAQCGKHASLMQYLLNSMGANGSNVVYFWGGTSASTITTHNPTVGFLNYPDSSIRAERLKHDGVLPNPWFTFHALVSIDGKYFDPSYGLPKDNIDINLDTTFNGYAPADRDNSPFWNFPSNEDTDFNGNGVLDVPQRQSGAESEFTAALQNKKYYRSP